jgi:hypothetical protein
MESLRQRHSQGGRAAPEGLAMPVLDEQVSNEDSPREERRTRRVSVAFDRPGRRGSAHDPTWRRRRRRRRCCVTGTSITW